MSTPTAMEEAMELLQDEVESEVERANRRGGAAFAKGDHKQVAAELKRAEALMALQERLNEMREAFPSLFTPDAPANGRLPKGLKTKQEAYRQPILRALVELGGKASLDDVLGRVYDEMKDQLNEYDLRPMPSDESTPRWRNTAQWARNSMHAEGLLKSDSPRGIWEISEAGRAALKSM